MEYGFGTFLFVLILMIISCVFGIATATYIATALGATGFDWWIIAITLFGTFGGANGSIINLVFKE